MRDDTYGEETRRWTEIRAKQSIYEKGWAARGIQEEARRRAERIAKQAARDAEWFAREAEELSMLTAYNRVIEHETQCVDELIDPPRPW